jgi:hypothetical protein
MGFKLNGSSATILASLIGGVCALAAAVVPTFFPTKPEPAGPQTIGAGIQASANAPTTPSASSAALVAATPGAPLAPASAPPAPAPVAAPRPNFSYGSWTIVDSKGDDGNTWNNSTIKFTSEQPTADGVEFAGFFEWRMNDRLLGREFFSGRYLAADRMMYFEGQSVQSPTNELAVGSFSCKLSEDGRKLLDGTWGNTPGNLTGVLGVWTARR